MRYLLLLLLLIFTLPGTGMAQIQPDPQPEPVVTDDTDVDVPPEPSSCDIQIQRWMVPVEVHTTIGGTCADPLSDPDNCHNCIISIDDDVRIAEVLIYTNPSMSVQRFYPAIIGKNGRIIQDSRIQVLVAPTVETDNFTVVQLEGGVE
jgi:hypothetical protein